jgi:hypothetical protein
VEHCTEAATDYVDEYAAEHLARNVVQMLSWGRRLDCIRNAVEHRRQKLGWRMSDERAARLVAALERAWAKGTREVEGR